MAINKVEYKLDSMTAGFASAGDEVTIKKSNADIIQQDVDNEKTENLSNSQQKYLAHCTNAGNNDDTEYGDGAEPDGEIGENGENNSEGPGAGTAAGTMVQSAGAMFFGAVALEGIKLNTPKMCAWVAPWVGAINVGLAEASIVNAAMFDSEYARRTNERSEEEGYASILDATIASLNEDLEALKGNEKLTQLTNMQTQYEQLIEEGKIDEADELLSQMDATRAELVEGDDAIDIEAFATNNEFAHEFDDYSRSVSEFLKVGNSYGQFGVMNSVALTACTAASIVMSVLAFRAVNLANVSLAASGAALCIMASAMYAVATGVMINKSVQEFDCGAKGNDLESKANELVKPMEDHDNAAVALGVLEDVAKETESLTAESPTEGTGSGGAPTGGTGDSGSTGGSTSGTTSGGTSSSGGSSSGSSSSSSSSSTTS